MDGVAPSVAFLNLWEPPPLRSMASSPEGIPTDSESPQIGKNCRPLGDSPIPDSNPFMDLTDAGGLGVLRSRGCLLFKSTRRGALKPFSAAFTSEIRGHRSLRCSHFRPLASAASVSFSRRSRVSG